MRAIFLCLLALAIAPVAAFAQTGADDPIAACRAAHGADATARIACLESAIARMQGRVTQAEQEAQQAQQQVAEAQQQVQQAEARRERPDWSLPGFRAREVERQDESVRVQITRVRYGRDGLGIFVMADGKVWQETTAAPERRWLESGRTYEAVIDRGVFGGFRMNVDGIRWEYKVEPIN